MSLHWWCVGFGHGRGWLQDQWTGVLMAVDPCTLRASIHSAGPPRPPGSGRMSQVLVTETAVWLSRDRWLVRVDPDSSEWRAIEVPVRGDRTWWTAAAGGMIGTDWPSGRLIRVDDDGSVRTADLGGHLEQLTGGGPRLWVIDRADDTLLCADAATLTVGARVRFEGGWVETLLPAGDTVLVSHAGDVRRGTPDGVWRVDADGRRELVWEPPEPSPWIPTDGWFVYRGDGMVRSGRAPTIAATDGATLWIAAEGPDRDLDADPVATITPTPLATGRAVEPLRVPGQIADLRWAFGRLWCTGFVRSRQATVLTLLDSSGMSEEVDFSGVDLEPHRPVPVRQPAPDYDAELDGLVEQLRVSLTTPWTAQDHRTGERRAGGPAVHEDFTLVGLALDRVAPAVRVTFRWAAEPGVTFAYDHLLSIPPVTSSIAGDASIFITEEICTGLVRRAGREQCDGYVLLRSTSPDPF